MQIDWITVSAQIVNFLLLVWLLKHFLYEPVIRAMDRREQRVTDRLREAREREDEAESEAKDYREKQADFEEQREQLLEDAREQARQERKKLVEEAREEVADSRRQWQAQADRERERFLGDLRTEAAGAVQAVARKALSGLADAGLEEQIVSNFLERLDGLDEDTRQALARAEGPVRVATTFELDSHVRGRITRAVHTRVAEEAEVAYERSDDLLCGIELTAGGHRLGWHLAGYLERLDDQLADALQPVRERDGEDAEQETEQA